LKSLLWYIPETKGDVANELVLWLFPRFEAGKTRKSGIEWIPGKASLWEKSSERRDLGDFIKLLDVIARHNRVRQNHTPPVEGLVHEVFCWCGLQEGCLSVPDVVSFWGPKVCPPIERLLRAVQRREEVENLLRGWIESE
jgi:hypothetical protein